VEEEHPSSFALRFLLRSFRTAEGRLHIQRWKQRLFGLLTFFGHASGEALLQTAVLTPVPSCLVYHTAFLFVASVDHIFLHTPSKETLRKNVGDERYIGGGKDNGKPCTLRKS
jgi:hypothetical protein